MMAVVGLFWIAGAQALHDNGFFQLDRNAYTSIQSTPTALEDWDKVCPASTPAGIGGCLGGTTADASTFDIDPADDGPLGSAFSTGGSKDTNDITSWLHTSTPVPGKDDLLHGYAAREGDDLFFGADRAAVQGTATLGVWFLQDDVRPLAGGTFSGSHQNGDLLVLADFQATGANSSVRVFEWQGTGAAGSLVLIAGTETTPSDCVGPPPHPTTGAGSEFCATANIVNANSPWAFQSKSGPPNIFLPGLFFEGGVDLAALDLEGGCFSTFLAETRTSNSPGSQLKDFVTGQLESCGASINTVPSTTSIVLGGGSVTDSATISVTGGGSPPAPTGTVSFFLCGPSQTQITSCTPGVTPFDTKPLSGAVQSGNDYTVTSAAAPITGAGFYCFAASWPGDTNYTGGPFIDGDSSECFQVTKALAPTNTSPSSTSITLGQSVTDHAVVTGIAAGGPPTGTVTFSICSPSELTPANTGTCTTGGTLVGSAVTLTPIASTNNSEATSASFQPTGPGKWCWRGEYSGDNNYQASSDSDESECLTVISLTPAIATAQFFYPNDAATITVATGGGDLAGNVRFRAYTDVGCLNLLFDSGNIDVTTGTGGGLSRTVETNNTTNRLNAANPSVYWDVDYDSTNPAHQDVDGTCGTENSTITINNG